MVWYRQTAAHPRLFLFTYLSEKCLAGTSVELGGDEEPEGKAGRIIPALGLFWQRLNPFSSVLRMLVTILSVKISF